MLSLQTHASLAVAAGSLVVNSTVAAMACKLDANALVRVVLTASKKEFDDVEFWNGADETRIERNVGDSVAFVKDGIGRVMVLAQKLQLLQTLCQAAIADKVDGEQQVRSILASLAALGIGGDATSLTTAADEYARQRVLLEKAAELQVVLAAEAAKAFDQLSSRMFDLYGCATSEALSGKHQTMH